MNNKISMAPPIDTHLQTIETHLQFGGYVEEVVDDDAEMDSDNSSCSFGPEFDCNRRPTGSDPPESRQSKERQSTKKPSKKNKRRVQNFAPKLAEVKYFKSNEAIGFKVDDDKGTPNKSKRPKKSILKEQIGCKQYGQPTKVWFEDFHFGKKIGKSGFVDKVIEKIQDTKWMKVVEGFCTEEDKTKLKNKKSGFNADVLKEFFETESGAMVFYKIMTNAEILAELGLVALFVDGTISCNPGRRQWQVKFYKMGEVQPGQTLRTMGAAKLCFEMYVTHE